MVPRVQHTLVIVRHISGFKPAVTHVSDIVSDQGNEESHAEKILEEVKRDFLSKFKEFEDSDINWIVHLERRH